MRRISLFLLLICSFLVHHSFAQVSLTVPNGTYNQNFDGMASTTVYPTGWTAIRIGGTGAINATLVPGVTNGSTNAGNVHNVGTTSAADRALGTLGSGATVPAFGVSFVNNTGSAITSFNLSGFHEQWRTGSNLLVETVVFEYSTDATSLSTGVWTGISSLNLVEILTANVSNVAVDGNNVANRVAISGNIPSLSIPVGGTIWIRWRDTDDAGSDGLYAVDDLQLSYSNGVVSTTVSVSSGINAAEPSTSGTFNLSLSSPAPSGGVTVNYSLTGGSAILNSDYSDPQAGTVTIGEGNTSGVITLNVIDDPDFEGTETISINLDNATNGFTIGTGNASINLLDNDSPPTVSVAAGTNAAEPATNGTFTINFSTATTGSTDVSFAYTGSASFGTDYSVSYSTGTASTSTSTGVLTVPGGTSSVTVTINTINDPDVEGTETISLTLSLPTGG